MPEGPEVETIRRSLEKRLIGQRIESVWRSDFALRTPTTSKDLLFLIGAQIKELSRAGKILIVDADKERGLFFQFGMSGRLLFLPIDSPIEKHTHLRMGFNESPFELRFIDPRRFGDIKLFRNSKEREQVLTSIGPDVITFTRKQIKTVAALIQKADRPIKSVLLDQSAMSGIGNIYACEALHLAKISPVSLSSALELPTLEHLLCACQDVMKAAVENKGTTFRSYLDGNGDKGANQIHLRVFAKENEACIICGQTIKRIVQSGRSTFYCPMCQS